MYISVYLYVVYLYVPYLVSALLICGAVYLSRQFKHKINS